MEINSNLEFVNEKYSCYTEPFQIKIIHQENKAPWPLSNRDFSVKKIDYLEDSTYNHVY